MESTTIRRGLIAFTCIGALIVGYMAVRWLTPANTTLTFATGQPGGLYHELAQAISQEIKNSHPHLTIRLMETKGSLENVKHLENGAADLALIQNDTVAGVEVRSLTTIHPELLHFLCRRDSEVNSLYDLSGKRIAVGPRDSGSEKFTRELFDFLGIDRSTFAAIEYLSIKDATEKLTAGELDAMLFLTGLGNDACRKALQSGHVELKSLVNPSNGSDWANAEPWARTLADGFRAHYPYVTPHTVPLMAYPGKAGSPGHPRQPIPSVGVQAVLVCHRDLPDELAETVTRIIYEHRAVLSQKHAAFSHLDENTAESRVQFPLHSGAERYLRRDEPGFLVKYAEAMGFILSASILLWGLGSGVRKWLLQKRKDRIDKYYQAIESIIGRLREGEESLDNLEEELITLRKDALHELVKEKLAADESFVIYQNMANGCQQLLAQKKQERRQGV